MDANSGWACQCGGEGLLRAGLSDRSRDPGNPRRSALSACDSEGIQRGRRVGDQNMGVIDRLRHDRACCTLGEGLFDKAVPIGGFAQHRHKQIAFADFPAIEGHTRNGEIDRGFATGSKRYG
jgi:hypothetical protein